MLAELDGAHLAFAAVQLASRGKGCHLALLRRQILDAAAARSRLLVAETVEPLEGGEPSPRARNLFRAGFQRDSERFVWRRPLSWDE